MMRVNSSELWNHFDKEDGQEKKAKCKICKTLLSYKTTTGNLKTHLKLRHIEAYRTIAIAHGNNAPPTAPTASIAIQQLVVPNNEPPTAPAQPGIAIQPVIDITNTEATTSVTRGTKRVYQDRIDGYVPKKITKDQKAKVNCDLLNLFIDGYQPFSLVEEQ